MAQSNIQLQVDGSGKKIRTYDKGTPGHDQYVIPTTERLVSFSGRCSTFRIPGRAGTTGQKIFAIHNATGSTVLVAVKRISVDLAATAAKLVMPPSIRVNRLTVLPTNGTAASKVNDDTSQSSSSSVTLYQDASADQTSSGTALVAAATANSVLEQEYAPRIFTLAGYEPADRIYFLEQPDIVLHALQGLCVELSYTVATQNPITDMWTVTCWWDEFTLP